MTKEEKENPKLGRRALGIAQPGERAGVLVAIAEEEFPIKHRDINDLNRVGGRVYKFHFLEEIETWNLDQLFTRCSELIRKYWTSLVFGRRDEGNMGNIWAWNARHPGSEFDVWMAPYSKDGKIGHHINILIERLENGTLVLPKDSLLWSQFKDVKRGQIHLATDTQFPAVAALGFVVAALDRDPPEPEQEVNEPPDDVDPITGY